MIRATTNVSVLRQFFRKASAASPAISPKPSSTITMAARRERLQARMKGFLV
jgi:hypothetical protein